MALKELLEIDDLQEVYAASEEKPVLLFKQSTTCPISASAFRAYQQFLEQTDENAYFVKVRENRSVSNQIETDLEVQNQSTKIFIVKNKEEVWNASHYDTNVNNIAKTLEEA